MRWFVRNLAGPLLAVLLLLGVMGTTALRMTPADVGDYHQRVQQAVNEVPYVIGGWIGQYTPVPTQATDMLQPNALLSRRYTDSRTGHTMQVLLVHCRDARLLKGHYPPECYPAQGWLLTRRQHQAMPVPADAPTKKDRVQVMQYAFTRDRLTGRSQLEVLNLMVLPDGRFDTGMGGVAAVSGDYTLRHLGAGELQMIPDPAMTAEQRQQAFRVFFEALAPALNTIRTGREQAADSSAKKTAQ